MVTNFSIMKNSLKLDIFESFFTYLQVNNCEKICRVHWTRYCKICRVLQTKVCVARIKIYLHLFIATVMICLTWFKFIKNNLYHNYSIDRFLGFMLRCILTLNLRVHSILTMYEKNLVKVSVRENFGVVMNSFGQFHSTFIRNHSRFFMRVGYKTT